MMYSQREYLRKNIRAIHGERGRAERKWQGAEEPYPFPGLLKLCCGPKVHSIDYSWTSDIFRGHVWIGIGIGGSLSPLLNFSFKFF